ncbi:MAG: hypothetical protein H6Q44_1932, partial [Deltaproteobacteria bacterium]|nr:hypothetical protein [Deltaproteobacteria bacterium]
AETEALVGPAVEYILRLLSDK